MALTIASNISADFASNALRANDAGVTTALERLSTGKRINSAKDDAAGLAISERMAAQVRGLNVAARNINDGTSLLQVADGALSSMGELLQRMRELRVQSLNGTNSDADRSYINVEIAQLKEQLNKVKSQTEFNGKPLLDGTFVNQQIVTGANVAETIPISLDDFDNIVLPSDSRNETVNGIRTPQLLGVASVPLAGASAISGNYAVVSRAGNGNTIDIIDASDPAMPKAIASLDCGARTGYIAIKDNFAYVGVYGGGMRVVDISNPASPAAVGGFPLSDGAWGVKIIGTTLYSLDSSHGGGLRIYDITNPAAGVLLGQVSGVGSGGLTVSGGTAIVSDIYNGAQVIDISNPAAPAVVSNLPTPGFTYQTAVKGNYAFVPDRTGIKIFDISNPGAPTQVSHYSGSQCFSLAVNGNALYAAENGNGEVNMVTLDITDPLHPVLQSKQQIDSNIRTPQITSEGEYVYVGAQDEGFKVFYTGAGLNERTYKARDSLPAFDAALDKLNSLRGKIGAYSNRLDGAVSNALTLSENTDAARSRIVDADYAVETSNLSRGQILKQAATAMVAQANTSKQVVLSLLDAPGKN